MSVISEPNPAKSKPRKTATPPADTLADDLLNGAQAIADYLGFELRETYHALERGYVPATKRGRVWIGSKRRLRRHYSGE